MDASSYVEMLSAMRATFATGKTKPYNWRIDQLNKMLTMVKDNEDVFLDALQKDLRKCKFESKVSEFSMIYKDLSLTIESLHNWMKPERVKRDLMTYMDDCYIRPEPLGVVLLITPWNYPIQLTFACMIGAIAAGNCVVVKPSELAPASSAAILSMVEKYLDPECIKVLEGGIAETTCLLEQRFDLIMYTGSTAVGRIVMQAAAKHLTPVILELGGKSPCYVDENCDFDVAANRILWGKCINSGQTCIAPDYILCSKDVEVKLIESLKKTINSFFGEDVKSSECYGRMINSRHFERVKALMEKSGTVVIGGDTDASDKFISPTVLTDVKVDDPIMQEEIFGPVLPIITVNSLDEAIQYINKGEKPLTMYAFSTNQKVLDRLLHETSSGSFLSNDTIVVITLLTMPFGGVGHSGIGCYHGKYSFDSFSHRRSVMMKSQALESVQQIRYPPYTSRALNCIMNWLIKTSPSKRYAVWFPSVIGLALTAMAIYLGLRSQT